MSAGKTVPGSLEEDLELGQALWCRERTESSGGALSRFPSSSSLHLLDLGFSAPQRMLFPWSPRSHLSFRRYLAIDRGLAIEESVAILSPGKRIWKLPSSTPATPHSATRNSASYHAVLTNQRLQVKAESTSACDRTSQRKRRLYIQRAKV